MTSSNLSAGNPAVAEWLASPACEERMRSLMDKFHLPGLSVAVVDGDKIHSKAWGLATIDPPVACTPDTIFDVASISKAVTSLALAILKDDPKNPHKFEWDTLMASLLPDDFVMSDPEATKAVTVEDMLSHRTGLPGHDTCSLGVKAANPDTPRSVVRNLRHLALTKPLRSTYQYTNILYTAATHLLEALTAVSFGDYLQTHVFTPLQMSSTYLQPTSVPAARLSTPYTYSLAPLPHATTPEAQGAGSICSTAGDFALLLRALLTPSPPITAAMVAGLTEPRIMHNRKASLSSFGPESTESAYALGWDVRYLQGERIVAHDGVIPGYGSRMCMIPSRRFGVVALGNGAGAFDVTAVVVNLINDLVLGKEDKGQGVAEGGRDKDEGKTVEGNAKQQAEDEKPDAKGKKGGKGKAKGKGEGKGKGNEGGKPNDGGAERRIKKFLAQHERQEKNRVRNAERRAEAKEKFVELAAYLGEYWNDGYRGVIVEDRTGELFIDGSDRSMPFTMLLEHVKDGKEFRGYLAEIDGREDMLPIEFKITEEGKVEAIGIAFEEELGDELIWFQRR